MLVQEEAAAAPGRHLTLLPRGPAAEQTVGSPRSHHRRHSSATTPGLISAALGRTAPPPWLGACLLLTKAGCCRERSAHPDSRQVNARLPSPNSPKPPPRIDDGRPLSLPPRHQAPPHYATPQYFAPRVSGLESFGVRCPAPLVPPDHLLPGALGHRSLHCLGAGPALDRGPPIQAPPAYCPPAPLLSQANLTIMIADSKTTFQQRSLYLASQPFRSISKTAAQMLYEVFQKHVIQTHMTTQPKPKTTKNCPQLRLQYPTPHHP